MNIKKFLDRLRAMFARLEVGNALAEYMPTIAGAMVVTTVALVQVGGGAKQSFCKVTDAFGDPPVSCETDADKPGDEGDPGDVDDPGGPGGPGDIEEPADPECVITISSADGTDPSDWNTQWDGQPDVLFVEVSALPEPVSWSLKLRFPTDPDGSEDVEIDTGMIEEDGTYEIVLNYPPAEEWSGPSTDGQGTYESHATLHITDPCGDVGWDRWFKSAWEADLGIVVEHDVSPVTTDGETLNYTVTVTNYGPTNAQVYEGQGTVVNLPMPEGVWVEDVSPSQGECELQCDWGDTAGMMDGSNLASVFCPKWLVVCDLGEMPYMATATIGVETTVWDVATCDLYAEGNVSAPRPPDPNPANDWDDTSPFCEMVCEINVIDLVLVDAKTDNVISAITDGMEITLTDGDEITIDAQVSGSIGSVVFDVNGSYFSTENVAPYAIAGDSGGNYHKWSVSAGSYTVTATPYSSSHGGGETCSSRTVNFTIVQPEEEEDPTGEIYDPNQPTGDPEATCPTGYESLVAYDHLAKAGQPQYALQWNNASRESHTYNFELGGDWDTVLVTRGAVGHPEESCPEGSHKYCSWPNQINEHWAIDINGSQVAFYPDNGALDHVYLIYPDVHLGVMPAGSHELRMYHAGLLDDPKSGKPSVGAFVRVCVDKGEEEEETPGGWDRSSVNVEGYCDVDNGNAVFTVENTGDPGEGNMEGPVEWRLFENGTQVQTGSLQIDGGEIQEMIFPGIEGKLRLEVDQRPGHPGMSRPNAEVEECSGGDAPAEQTVCIDHDQLGVATDFNTFTLGNHNSPWGSDTEGRMAVGGNATIGSYSVADKLDPAEAIGQDVLIVGGDLNFSNGRVYYGNAVVGGTKNVSQSATIEGELLSGSPINFGSASANLKALSTVFADAEANGTTTLLWSTLTLEGSDPQLNVFEVTSSQLNSMSGMAINIPSGSTALINVTGTNVTFKGVGQSINGQQGPSAHGQAVLNDIAKVIYNFPNATTLSIPWGGINGAILAPKANVTFNSGVIWGTMVSGSFEGQGQLNHVPFRGCVPAMTY